MVGQVTQNPHSYQEGGRGRPARLPFPALEAPHSVGIVTIADKEGGKRKFLDWVVRVGGTVIEHG
jgi:hypothetical protein